MFMFQQFQLQIYFSRGKTEKKINVTDLLFQGGKRDEVVSVNTTLLFITSYLQNK